MKKFLLFILILSSYFCDAQNYQCLQSGVKHYFTNSLDYLRGIRIDSVKTMGDTVVYYPFHTPRGIYNTLTQDSLNAAGGSWLGGKVLQLSDGTFIFDDDWSDSVIIKTQANLTDNWIFYQDTSSLYYLATVVSVDTMTFAGFFDTVKTIQINAYNGTALVTSDPVNGFQILLSKNHGFVQVFDLYTFPYHLANSGYYQGLDYYLDLAVNKPPYPLGLNVPIDYDLWPSATNSIYTLCSFKSPSTIQLYQWNIGDVYEYANCFYYNSYLSGCGCGPVGEFDMDTIKSVNAIADTVNYGYSGWAADIIAPEYFFYSYSPVASVVTIDSILLIDTTLMPEEYGQNSNYYYSPNDTSYCITGPFYGIVNSVELSGAVYYPPFEAGPVVVGYKAPLGLLYGFGCSSDTRPIVNSRQLIYYDRAAGGCGAPPNIPTSVPIVGYNNSIEIFPNPATTSLTIQSSNEPITQVSISNIFGQTVYSRQPAVGSLQCTVDVSALPCAMYFLQVNGSTTRKFVKE